EHSHPFKGAPQYACYGSWVPAAIRHKPIQVLFTLNEPLIRVAVVANPEQEVEIACVLRFTGGEKGYVDFVKLHQFRGVQVRLAEVEVRQLNVLISAGTFGDEVCKAHPIGGRQAAGQHRLFVRCDDEQKQANPQEEKDAESVESSFLRFHG